MLTDCFYLTHNRKKGHNNCTQCSVQTFKKAPKRPETYFHSYTQRVISHNEREVFHTFTVTIHTISKNRMKC